MSWVQIPLAAPNLKATLGFHHLKLLLLLSLAGATACLAVPPENPVLSSGFSQMYNLQFQAAHQTFQGYQQSHPTDPLGPVSDAAAYLFSEFNRLGILQSQFLTDNNEVLHSHPKEDVEIARKFEAALSHTDTLVTAALKASPVDPNALLAQAMRFGLHADYLALIQKRELAALSEIKQGVASADRLLAAHPDYHDAYIAKGVENYLLSLKPAPVRWLLRATGAQTDRDAGIAQLRKTAADGQFLSPYAKVLLAVAALRADNTAEAKQLLTYLAEHYPGNPLYRNELAKLP